MNTSNWNPDNISDQTGKIAIVTGANSGIGYEAALVMAQKNVEVILAVRNQSKGDEALNSILQTVPNAKLRVEILDLASLKSVNTFAEKMLGELKQLDLLINNAGIMVPPYSRTEDGFESQMGTNHMGHFALTAKLYPLLNATANSRIVNVSSNAHNMGNLNFEDLHWENRKYSAWKAYGDTKIANLYFTYEMDRRLKAVGSSVIVTAAHPGWSFTNLTKGAIVRLISKIVAQSQYMGSLPTLMAAFDTDAIGGEYYGPSGMGQQRGFPKKVESNPLSKDEGIARQLWETSETLTKTPFKI